jgi:hypothetical protein
MEEVYMNTNSNERGQEVNADVEVVEEELVEVGKVSETKGGFFGPAPDTGGGWRGN